ncbi:MAG: hypothetical protein ACJ75J_18470 [Cytophagaceae bacterium]
MKPGYILLFLLFFQQSVAQTADVYYVIHLKGAVVNKTTGKPVIVGDKLGPKDQLKFPTAEDLAVVMSPTKGKYTVKPNPTKNANNEFVAFMQSAILPVKSNTHLSTRGSEENGVMDMKNYFGSDKFVIVGENISIRLNAEKYPMSDTKFFIYRYMHGEKPVSKKIEHNNGNLVIDKKALYTVDGTAIDPSTVQSVDIYYYDSATRNSTKVTTFSPVFLAETTLKEECKVQKDVYKGQNMNHDQIDKELHKYVTDVYGKTDDDILEKWIKANHAD